jgi:hypothetical protein
MSRKEQSGTHLAIVRRAGGARIRMRAHGGGAGRARGRVEPGEVLGAEL